MKMIKKMTLALCAGFFSTATVTAQDVTGLLGGLLGSSTQHSPLGAVVDEGKRYLGAKKDQYVKKIRGEQRVSARERMRQEALAQERSNKPVIVKKAAPKKPVYVPQKGKTAAEKERQEFEEWKQFKAMKAAQNKK